MQIQEFDYIVVGGGSAGCAVAGRLSEDSGVTVCLLEAGPSDDSVVVRAPLGFAATAPWGIRSWHYRTVPQPGLNGRKGFQPRGKSLGGSSSINAMVYTRGNPLDYDHWSAQGNPGWSYNDLLPLFQRAEHSECFGATEHHGASGPINVGYLRSPSPLNEAFMQACVEQGIPRNPDYNAQQQFGVSPAQVTQKNGERWNAVRAYITPHQGQSNLQVICNAHSRRILLDGKRATGVEYQHEGSTKTVKARREVILSAGAYGSPQLLMLSGIGAPEQLERHGIAVQHALTGVGQNLQDHLTAVLIYRTARKEATLGASLAGTWALIKAMFEWRKHRTGWISTNVAETQGFISTENRPEHPDIQLALCMGIVDEHTRKPHLGHGYTLHLTLMRPKSRGSVTLASADPFAAPLIDPAYLSHPDDMATMLRATRMGYDIMQSAALTPYRGPMVYPLERDNDAQIEQFIRRHSDTEYHPVGTCKMGSASDPMAVVDAQLRVHGLQGLRVADASIMPSLITGNTNAPCMMIGEKAAALIRAGH